MLYRKSAYKFSNSYGIKVSAQVAGEECERLAATGPLTPKRLLDANREEGTPLHDEFEWDDSVAAENYRESQAAHIIRAIVVDADTVEDDPRAYGTVRAFVRVAEETGTYTPIRVAAKDSDMMEALRLNAKHDMKLFVQKYGRLENLAQLITQMKELLAS